MNTSCASKIVAFSQSPFASIPELDLSSVRDWAPVLETLAQIPGATSICASSNGRVRLKMLGGYCQPVLRPELLTDHGWAALCQILDPGAPDLATEEHGRECGREVGSQRFRVARVRYMHGQEFTLRILRSQVPTPEELLLPPQLVKRVLELPDGLIVFAGRTGHGKTTSIAALAGLCARSNPVPVRVITVEDPVEYLHHDEPNGSTFTQREIGSQAKGFAEALRQALRMDPDILVIGEIRDSITAEIALEASLTGHKVFTTSHGGNVIEAMQRLHDLTPKVGTLGVGALAQAFRACVAQRLLRVNAKSAIVPIHEILTSDDSVASKIRGYKFFSLRQDMEAGKEAGMQTFTQAAESRGAQGLLPRDFCRQYALYLGGESTFNPASLPGTSTGPA